MHRWENPHPRVCSCLVTLQHSLTQAAARKITALHIICKHPGGKNIFNSLCQWCLRLKLVAHTQEIFALPIIPSKWVQNKQESLITFFKTRLFCWFFFFLLLDRSSSKYTCGKIHLLNIWGIKLQTSLLSPDTISSSAFRLSNIPHFKYKFNYRICVSPFCIFLDI